MKKSKLSVGLVASFIGALAVTACDSTVAVTEKKGELVELVDYNGNKIEIKTDDIYGKYTDSSDGTKLYYDAILEALIRYEYPLLSKQGGSKLRSIDTLKAEVEDKYTSARETANDNADTNDTSFDEEWEKILDSYNCEDDDDLKAYYLYQLEKEEISDWYAKENISALKDQYLGVKNDWSLVPEADKVENVNSLFPYHILHVLVSLSADKDNYNRGTITEAEATKLWQVVRQLIDENYSFEDVAFNLSDDTGSKSAYGDVGIMSLKTSFYNEFKLGIYAYDAILSGVNAQSDANKLIYESLGLNKESATEGAKVITETTVSGGVHRELVADLIKEEMVENVTTPVSATYGAAGVNKLPTVPYQVFKLISDMAKEDKVGAAAPEAGDVALPRNVLFNQFLNFHSPFVITAEDIVDNDNFDDDTVNVVAHDFTDDAAGNLYIKDNNFEEVAGFAHKVLCDKKGNVVIGVRSEAGIHFMVMRKSVFKATEAAVGRDGQSLQDYYTTAIPGEDDYPATGETYVNMKTTDDQSYYKDRADTIKNELKSTNFDAAYDYRLYEYLTQNDLVKNKITFSNPEVEENIEEYIKLLRETKVVGDAKSINDSWQSYLLMLSYQNTVRGDFTKSMVPTTCAFNFNNGIDDAEFDKGGKCYVASK